MLKLEQFVVADRNPKQREERTDLRSEKGADSKEYLDCIKEHLRLEQVMYRSVSRAVLSAHKVSSTVYKTWI